MKADPDDQRRLLDLAALDTRLAQLGHAERTMPEAVELAAAEALRERLDDALVEARTELSDLASAVQRAEADVQVVRDREARDQQLLLSGDISDPRQLESLQHELASLARRKSDLEDAELAVLEQVEAAEAVVSRVEQERSAAQDVLDALVAQVAARRAEIDGERTNVQADRAPLAAALPAELIALYQRIGSDLGGVGAAMLHRGRCEGCRLQLPPNEIEAIRGADPQEVLRCEECRRILVRTAESGL